VNFRRDARRRSGPRNLLLGLVIFLCVLTAVQAFLLLPLLDRSPEGNGALTAERNLPERDVRILAAAGTPSLILKTPLDLPEADRLEDGRLDEQLFPGGDRHRYYVLHAREAGEEPAAILLPLVLEDVDGTRFEPLDLAAAIRSRRDALPRDLRLYLELNVPDGTRVEIPAKSSRRILLAYPEAAEPARLARGRIDGRELTPRIVRKDELDGLLDSLPSARGGRRP
jgi:hypothetical protein